LNNQNRELLEDAHKKVVDRIEKKGFLMAAAVKKSSEATAFTSRCSRRNFLKYFVREVLNVPRFALWSTSRRFGVWRWPSTTAPLL